MVERPFTSSLCREIQYSAKCAWLLVRESGFLARLMVVGNSLILASWAICRDAGTFCEHGHKKFASRVFARVEGSRPYTSLAMRPNTAKRQGTRLTAKRSDAAACPFLDT